jgi:hypothetical protein
MTKSFSKWIRWRERDQLGDTIKNPGVYVIALSDEDIASTPFTWREEIIYIGMTRSKGGLKARLRQFDDTINWKKGHGGAERVRKKHRDYNMLVPRLFVSVNHTECDTKPNLPKPSDLRLMGFVLQQEYECFAAFAEKFKRWPEFNDKKNAPKK